MIQLEVLRLPARCVPQPRIRHKCRVRACQADSASRDSEPKKQEKQHLPPGRTSFPPAVAGPGRPRTHWKSLAGLGWPTAAILA